MRGNANAQKWRLIIDGPADAATNMARDEAMLLAAQGVGLPALRFYSWRPWALSIGYFQHYAEFTAHAARGIPVVRRPTGGGAVYHADEVTYSLVGPFGRRPFPQRAAGIFEKVHAAIAGGLRGLGVDANLSDAPAGRSSVICFARVQKYDIVAGGRKLVGSAQRRYKGRFLQQGSLPLSPNEFAPEAVTLGELVEKRPDTATIVDALREAFEGMFGVRFVRGALTEEEGAAARRLAAEKYSGDRWNQRR